MIQRIDHLGIAVRRLEDAIPVFERLLGSACQGVETVESQKVRTAFFQVGEVAIELLEATDASSPIAKFIESRGEGLHHVAFASDGVEGELKRVAENGARLIDETPRMGAHGKEIAFVHPKSALGVLVELCSPQRGGG